ncbi:unnamed protein product [Calicophoron daubneyi]|uniref:Exocyst complex component Sec8 n=1 Tax=Calicophoron daubneyi TaxID=300641 RepID=A0AAV2TTW5_CALDB
MTQSSYLMSFIRSLMEHSSKDVREKKKRQLEADFTETGSVLNTCLTEKFEDVMKVLNVYNSVSERVSLNISSVAKIKHDLVECKSLLYCNREELRRLWLELVEQRRCLELLDILDRLRSTPDALATLVTARAWPEATNLILYSMELSKSDIAVVPALQAVKTELAHKQKFIVDQLKKEMRSLIYDRPITLVLEKALKNSDSRALQALSSKSSTAGDGENIRSASARPITLSHYSTLPLSSWRTASVDEPPSDTNIKKDPHTVAAAIALNASAQAAEHTPKGHAVPEAEWIREIVAVTHCLCRLDKLSQILFDWRPQPRLTQHSLMNVQQNVFGAPLVPGQGLLGELHRFVVLKAINVVESKAILQGDTMPLSTLDSPRYLIKLLNLVFDALFMQARACLLIIRTMNSGKLVFSKTVRELEGLSSEYIWSCVQHEVQILLSMHLDKAALADPDDSSQNLLSPVTGSDISSPVHSLDVARLDLNALMGRKRMVPFSFGAPGSLTPNLSRTEQPASSASNLPTPSGINSFSSQPSPGSSNLFSFSNTSHYMSVFSYMRENRMLPDGSGGETGVLGIEPESSATQYPLVCQPNRDNITSIYKQVIEFVDAIELEMSYTDPSSRRSANSGILRRPSYLRLFLKNFIETTYLPDALNSLRMRLQQQLSAPDALNAIVSQQTERELGLNRPILMAVLVADQCLREVKRMSVALPEYGHGCLQIGTSLLNDFTAAMWLVYKSLSEVDSSGTTVPSSDWSKDPDISRFWKKFPVWQRMATQEARILASSALFGNTGEKSTFRGSATDSSLSGQNSSSGGPPAASPTSPDQKTADADVLESSARISPSTAVALGICNEYDMNAAGDLQSTARLVIPFANGRQGSLEAMGNADRVSEYMRLPGLLYEREATRLAAKETEQLIHIIRVELPDSAPERGQTRVTQSLPTVRNVHLIKVLGRMSESLCWLSHRVLSLDTWLQQIRRRTSVVGGSSPSAGSGQMPRQGSISSVMDSPFLSRAQELNHLSEVCLLMIYLELRIQAYNHVGRLPPDVTYLCPVDDVDVDKYVTDFLSYLEQVQDMLVHTLSRHKFRFIFDGLGDFISQLLLRLIPQIPRMNANGNKKMCRNVYRLQQALASLTETHESDLIRVKQLYELFHLTPEAVVNRLMEQGVAFDEKVYRDMLELYQRSHPTHPYAKTKECIAKLATVVRSVSR